MEGGANGDHTIGERIREDMHRFTTTERKAAHVLLANYPVAGLETVAEFGKRAGVSAPTVLRFVGRLGFSSYPEFQRALRDELDKQGQSPLMKARFAPPEGAGGPYERFAETLAQNLSESFKHLPMAEFEAVADALGDRKRRVAVGGGRFTDALARSMVVHLRVVRGGVSHLDGQIANWRDQIVDMGPRDLIVLFDIRRYQDDLFAFAEAAAGRGISIILFTDQWLSPITRFARHIVSARVAVPSRWDSMTALLGLVETLLAAVTDKTWDEASRRIEAIDGLRPKGKPPA